MKYCPVKWGFFHKPLNTDPYEPVNILESKTVMTIYPVDLGIVINNQDYTTHAVICGF